MVEEEEEEENFRLIQSSVGGRVEIIFFKKRPHNQMEQNWMRNFFIAIKRQKGVISVINYNTMRWWWQWRRKRASTCSRFYLYSNGKNV